MAKAVQVMQGRRMMRVILFFIGFLAALLTGVHIGTRQMIFAQMERMDPADGERLQLLLGVQAWVGGVVLLSLLLIGFCVIRPMADDLDDRTTELGRLRMKQQAREGSEDGALPDRASLQELLMHDLARARRHGHALGLLRIGLTGMEGVPADKLERLREGVARTLRGTVRSSDYPAQVGTDDIVLIVPVLRTVEGLGVLADRLIAALGIYLRGKGHGDVRLTIGVAVRWPSSDGAADDLLAQADDARAEARQEEDGNAWQYHATAVQGLSDRLTLAAG